MDIPVTLEALDAVLAGARRPGTYAMTAVATDFSSVAISVVFGEFLGTGVSLLAAGANWTAAEVPGRCAPSARPSAPRAAKAWPGPG